MSHTTTAELVARHREHAEFHREHGDADLARILTDAAERLEQLEYAVTTLREQVGVIANETDTALDL